MAAIRYKHFQPFITTLKPFNIGWTERYRLYSQYAANYQKPIIDKNEIDKVLAEKQDEEIQCMLLKAAENNQTCSIFYDADVSKFTNLVMRQGKKILARDLVEGAFLRVKHIQLRKYNSTEDKEMKESILVRPLDVFHAALKNVTPVLDLRKIKRSGTWYLVPVGIKDYRAKFLGMRWIIDASKEKNEKIHFKDSLGDEIVAAASQRGKAFKKKLDMHKLCEANRGFSHYRWT